jgi:hypothetical protein
VGGVVGGLVLLCLIVLACWTVRRRRRGDGDDQVKQHVQRASTSSSLSSAMEMSSPASIPPPLPSTLPSSPVSSQAGMGGMVVEGDGSVKGEVPGDDSSVYRSTQFSSAEVDSQQPGLESMRKWVVRVW